MLDSWRETKETAWLQVEASVYHGCCGHVQNADGHINAFWVQMVDTIKYLSTHFHIQYNN